jgi:hypothetical protein
MITRNRVYTMPDKFGLRGRIEFLDRPAKEPMSNNYRLALAAGWASYVIVGGLVAYALYHWLGQVMQFAKVLK